MRTADSKSIIKRLLEDYHLRAPNSPQIFFAMDRAQQDLATRYDLIRKQVTLTMIIDQADYDVVTTDSLDVTAGNFVANTLYQITSVGTTDFTLIGAASNNVGVVFTATGVGTGDGIAQKAYRNVRKIKSMQVPNTWTGIIWHYTDQQWDQLMEEQPAVSRPQYVIYRNDLLTFHGSPVTAAEQVILQTYLHTAILPLSDSVEPEIPAFLDEAMEMYAVWFLLPLDHEQKEATWQRYDSIVDMKFPKAHNKRSQPIVARARW
jgi:hypothetical protein